MPKTHAAGEVTYASLNDLHELGKEQVVGHDTHELGKVPRVPLTSDRDFRALLMSKRSSQRAHERERERERERDIPNTHRKGVNVLVELIQQADTLDNVVIDTVDVELDLAARVGVRETELRLLDVAGLELLDELGKVHTHAADELLHERAAADVAADALLDRGGELLLGDAERHGGLALLLGGRGGLGQVAVEKVGERLVQHALGDGVDVGERLLGRLERLESHELHHGLELAKVEDLLLNLLSLVRDLLGLAALKERVARRRLEQQVQRLRRARKKAASLG